MDCRLFRPRFRRILRRYQSRRRIYFVGDDLGIVFLRQIGDDLQFFTGKYLAAGVGGIAENQGFGMLLEGFFQFCNIKGVSRWF